jgi:hypothetical protein
MKFLEKDLETIIYETPKHSLYERGLYINRNKYRQKRIGNYGIADIIAVEKTEYGEIDIQIIELKKDAIDMYTIIQVVNYAKGVSRYLEYRNSQIPVLINLICIGRKIDNDIVYMTESLRRCFFYTYSYDFDGIHFQNRSGYHLIDEGF